MYNGLKCGYLNIIMIYIYIYIYIHIELFLNNYFNNGRFYLGQQCATFQDIHLRGLFVLFFSFYGNFFYWVVESTLFSNGTSPPVPLKPGPLPPPRPLLFLLLLVSHKWWEPKTKIKIHVLFGPPCALPSPQFTPRPLVLAI